jgi:SAM-dependent methyltransferase
LKQQDAIALLRPAVSETGGTWADVGAGTGTFTLALAELLGPSARVFAVDRDGKALAELRASAAPHAHARIETVQADFTKAFELPGAKPGTLDGILLANSLHFVRSAEDLLARLESWLRPGGRIILIEYDRRAPNPWVPYPIWVDRLPEVAAAAGLSSQVVARRPSAFGGDLYVAVLS